MGKINKILLISGKSQSGKDTLGNSIESKWPDDICCFSFAEKLKYFINDLFGVPLELLFGTDEDKDQLTDIRWEDTPTYDGCLVNSSEFMTVRDLLKYFGSDICRKMYKYCWAKQVADDIECNGYNISLIRDLRMVDELDYIKERFPLSDIKTVRLLRKVKENDDWHESESGLDGFDEFDLYISEEFDEKETLKCVITNIKKWGFI